MDGPVIDVPALLVMDVQRGVVERFGDDAGYLSRVSRAVTAARLAGIPVIYVVVGFRPGHPEISARNRTFSAVASAGRFADGDPAAEIHPAVGPAPGDLVVTKRRVSAFAGSDLDVLLRGLGAGTLVLSGIATSGVVLSTLRQAADLDYPLIVLADACLDADPEVHRVLMEKVFPRQADVLTVAEWEAQLGTGLAGAQAEAEVEVLSGRAGDDLRWVVVAGGDDADFATMLQVYRDGRLVVAGSGFRGPKLYPGSVLNEWRGRTDDLPYFVMARTSPDVDRVVATTDRGSEVTLALSPPVGRFGLRFAAAALPAGERPGSLRAERQGRVLEVRPQPMPPPRRP